MTTKNLNDVLLLIPCCASKSGRGRAPAVESVLGESYLSSPAGALLEEGWRMVAEKYPDRFDLGSALLPATQWYTGNPYKMHGFRERLDTAFDRGLHCLIVSAGYGLLRPDDPIHYYDLPMSKTLNIWKQRLPDILADYVTRNGIRQVFGSLSHQYYDAVGGVTARLPGLKCHWCVPHHPRGAPGSAMQEVPKAVGQAVIDLIASDFKPDSRWSRG